MSSSLSCALWRRWPPQPALHELAHHRAALVGLHDVGRLVPGHRELERGVEVGERLGDALDGHVRVAPHELVVELRALAPLAAAARPSRAGPSPGGPGWPARRRAPCPRT